MKKHFLITVAVMLFTMNIFICPLSGKETNEAVKVSSQGQVCIGCHEALSPAFVQEWRISKHAQKGIDCYSCHKAEKTDPDAIEHNGFTIAILVTPNDCSKCHPQEVKRYEQRTA